MKLHQNGVNEVLSDDGVVRERNSIGGVVAKLSPEILEKARKEQSGRETK